MSRRGRALINLYPHKGGWRYRVEYLNDAVDCHTVWVDKEEARDEAERAARQMAELAWQAVSYEYEVPD